MSDFVRGSYIAEALGTTPAKLFASLRSGATVAEIAKASGTSLSQVRTAVKGSVTAARAARRDPRLTGASAPPSGAAAARR